MSTLRRGRYDLDWPSYGLEYLFDDRHDPEEVTIFRDGEGIATHWISADVGDAVAMEDCR